MRQESFQQDMQRFTSAVENLVQLISQESPVVQAANHASGARLHEKLETFNQRVIGELHSLREAAVRLEEQPEEHRVAVYIFTTAQVLEDEVDSTVAAIEEEEEEDDEDENTNGAIQRARNWINNTLKPAIKRTLHKLWKLLANLLTPKEWKLRGEVGSSLLGLGSASVEITFAP